MKIHKLDSQNDGSLILKIRALAGLEDAKRLEEEEKKTTCQRLFEKLETLLPKLQDATSSEEIEREIKSLNKEFSALSLDLFSIVGSRFKDTPADSAKNITLKRGYARIILILSFTGHPISTMISSSYRKDEDYNFCMDFLKSLSEQDKKRFICEAHCSTSSSSIQHAGIFVEIIGGDRKKARDFILNTLMKRFREANKPYELKSPDFVVDYGHLIEQQKLAVAILEDYGSNVRLEDIKKLYSLAFSSSILNSLRSLYVKYFGGEHADLFLEFAETKPRAHDLLSMDQERRLHGLHSYTFLKRKDAIDDLIRFLSDGNSFVVAKAIQLLLKKEWLGEEGREKLLATTKAQVEYGVISRPLACLTWFSRKSEICLAIVREIFNHKYSEDNSLGIAYRMLAGTELFEATNYPLWGVSCTKNSKERSQAEIISPIFVCLVNWSFTDEENEIVRNNARSVLRILSIGDFEVLTKEHPETVSILYDAADIGEAVKQLVSSTVFYMMQQI